MKIAVRIVKILLAIGFGVFAGFSVVLMLPLLFAFSLIKIIGGAAASIN